MGASLDARGRRHSGPGKRHRFGRIRRELQGRPYEVNPIEFCGAVIKWLDLIRCDGSPTLAGSTGRCIVILPSAFRGQHADYESWAKAPARVGSAVVVTDTAGRIVDDALTFRRDTHHGDRVHLDCSNRRHQFPRRSWMVCRFKDGTRLYYPIVDAMLRNSGGHGGAPSHLCPILLARLRRQLRAAVAEHFPLEAFRPALEPPFIGRGLGDSAVRRGAQARHRLLSLCLAPAALAGLPGTVRVFSALTADGRRRHLAPLLEHGH